MNDMDDRYSNIEEIGTDINDIGLLVDNGKKVIDILDSHLNNAYSRHNNENLKQIVHIEPKEVEMTNSRGVIIKYWTYAVAGYENFLDFDGDSES
jgi:hypothetical protein